MGLFEIAMVALVAATIYLAYHKKDGWGWLVFIIFCVGNTYTTGFFLLVIVGGIVFLAINEREGWGWLVAILIFGSHFDSKPDKKVTESSIKVEINTEEPKKAEPAPKAEPEKKGWTPSESQNQWDKKSNREDSW